MRRTGRWFGLLALACGGLATNSTATAFEPFEVSDIRLEGIQRIAPGTVFNALPVEVGERATQEQVKAAVRSLYDTGFFQDITIKRDEDVLVVELAERPAVANVEINGNDEIPDEDLRKVLREEGLAEGETFNRSLLSEIERGLRQQYFSLGLYDVDVESTVSPQERNRVNVRLDIREGKKALVQEVQFVGNESFSDERLNEEFEMGPAAWWALFSDSATYSRQRLSSDLESLRNFYQDRGYINFQITSTQVSISHDRRRVHVTANVDEGDQYKVGDVSLSGDLIFDESTMRELVAIEQGDLYSRKAISDSSAAMREKLGERGYAFANINAVPETDDEAKTVDITFFVDPAERMYVRRVNITGNERTRDDVIRRELLQQEGGWVSTSKIEESRRRLGRLGFFGTVDIETPRVPGTEDQVDVNVDVEEQLSGSFNIGAGFSDENGVTLSLGVQQDNLLGTGDRLAFNASNDRINTVYRLSYLERFHTKEGIDRNMSLSFRDTDAREANLSNFGVQRLTATYGYTIPLDLEDSIGVSAEYEDIELELGSEPNLLERRFVDENSEGSQLVRLNTDWTRDSRDRSRFPRRGSRQQVRGSFTVPGSDLTFYQTTVESRNYFPLTDRFTFIARGQASFGDGYGNTERMPFFEHFFAGGSRSVRGFESNTLGLDERDLDPDAEDDDPLGGNALLRGNLELRFPPPWVTSTENTRGGVRFTTFLDGGNVWLTDEQTVDPKDLRYSAGVGVTWFSPFGPLTASLAQPLNAEDDDEKKIFQFNIGTQF
jgi:outer membrane protein insertion porin family